MYTVLLQTGSRIRNSVGSVTSLDWSYLWISPARSGGRPRYQHLLLSDVWWQRQLGSHYGPCLERSTEL